MIANLFRRLKTRNKAIKKLEKEVNDPNFREEDLLLDEHGVPLVVHSDNKESWTVRKWQNRLYSLENTACLHDMWF